MEHLCASCGRLIDTEDWAEHTRTCRLKREPLILPDKPHQLPKPINGCKCDFCKGISTCPNCKLKTLYLDWKAGYWKCVKCSRYFHVGNIKHDENIPVIDNETQDLSQHLSAQERLNFWKGNLNDK